MIALSFSFSHHGRYSAYHRMLHYLQDCDQAIDASLPAWMQTKIFNPRGWSEAAWRCYKERIAYSTANSEAHEWLHYLYPEQSYFNGLKLKSKSLKVAMTCHLPHETFAKYGDYFKSFNEGLTIADAIILMSPSDEVFYSSLAANARTRFIPHGVDVHYFQPPHDKHFNDDGKATILTCGGMLRDFDTFIKVIEIAASRNVRYKFQLITGRDYIEKINSQLSMKAREYFEPLYGLSDAELLQRYHEADLLYLPLINATANNAILEAMACGIPLLLSDFPATRAYADCAACYLSGNDPEEALGMIDEIISDIHLRKSMSLMSRKIAVDSLAWEVVYKKQINFLHGD